MPFIDMGLGNDVQEKLPVPEGTYTLVAVDAQEHKKKGGTKVTSILVVHEIEGHTDAPTVRHYLPLVGPDDDPQKRYNKQLMVKRYLKLFGVPFEDGGFNYEDIIGCSAECFLQVENMQDDEGKETGRQSNKINLPNFENEV